MIVSYETLRTLQDELSNCPIGLLLADEGHRLKNTGESGARRQLTLARNANLPVPYEAQRQATRDPNRHPDSE